MIAGLPVETAVVLHDAGAANHAIAWIDAGQLDDRRVHAVGPAAAIWSKRARGPTLTLEQALDGAAALLSGTGWASDIEHNARLEARRRRMPSTAILDHWVNYHERFVREGITCLPDRLLVTDADAARLARECFPLLNVIEVDNIYLEQQLREIRSEEEHITASDLLVLMEPARNCWGRGIAGEFQALDMLLLHWSALGLADDLAVRIRPHPSEPPGKYDRWLAALPTGRGSVAQSSLAQEIARARVVAGLSSYALIVAKAAGRDVISLLPPWAPKCVLPQAGIRHVRDLTDLVA